MKPWNRLPEFQALAELPENRELIQMSKAVEGMKRHVSCHASGIVVSDGSIDKLRSTLQG